MPCEKKKKKTKWESQKNTLLQGHFPGQYRSGTGLVSACTDSGRPVEKTKKMGITEKDTTTRTLPRPVLIWYWPGIGSYKLWTPCGKKKEKKKDNGLRTPCGKNKENGNHRKRHHYKDTSQARTDLLLAWYHTRHSTGLYKLRMPCG